MITPCNMHLDGLARKASDAVDAAGGEVTIGLEAICHTSALRVYQCDLEVGALFVMPSTELLVTFKLLQPLARLDRCAGRNYADMHGRQANVLPAMKRFARAQRIHTSDGDRAVDLGECVLANRLLESSHAYIITTFRAQCQVHRVYHVMTMAMGLVSELTSGCIRLALSLR